MTSLAVSEFRGEQITTRRRRVPGKTRTAVAVSRRPRQHAKADFAQYRTRPWANVLPITLSILIVAAVWIGWLNREDSGLTPQTGIGYWLGIAGSSLMLLALLYPLRKRMPSLRVIGTVAFWFHTHMIIGVFGSVLVLWHSNFKLGSVNSSVTLVTMIIVAISGVVGRYVHSKIHFGLHGRKAEVQQILADADTLKGLIGADLPVTDRMVAQLKAFTQFSTAPPRGILAGLILLPVISWRGAVIRSRLIAYARQVITAEGKRLGRSRKVRRHHLAFVAELITLHVAATKKAATFAFYERLFGIWHVFHVPLFFLLVIVAIIHVFASHFF